MEAALALAMLPVGGVLALGSAVAAVVLLFMAVIGLFWAIASGRYWWFELWLIAAGIVAVRNTVTSIEIMSAFDWRPVASVVALSALAVAACPAWW